MGVEPGLPRSVEQSRVPGAVRLRTGLVREPLGNPVAGAESVLVMGAGQDFINRVELLTLSN